jgi:hypothetical protein
MESQQITKAAQRFVPKCYTQDKLVGDSSRMETSVVEDRY